MKRTKTSVKYFEIIIGIIFIVVVTLFGYFFMENGGMGIEESPYLSSANNNLESQDQNQTQFNDSENVLKVHFVDVGQGDSEIVELNGHYMLIDAGPNSSEGSLLEYINKLGIKKFDYVIGTHAHEDHIGGMDKIVKNYDIDKFLFPKQTATIKTFESFVTELNKKNLKLYAPSVGETFEFGDAKFTVFAPNSLEYDSANNYSIVIKLEYKNNSVLFTGDAEKLSENEMLENKSINLKSDVIKIGHHGSSTSSSLKFLNEVNPKYAVISLGKDNDYGHPHKSTILRLKSLNIPVYRTDEVSTIVMESDGNNIKFDKEKCSYNYPSSSKE